MDLLRPTAHLEVWCADGRSGGRFIVGVKGDSSNQQCSIRKEEEEK